MAMETIKALKRVAQMFRVPYMVLVYDFKELKRYNDDMSDQQLIDWMVEDMAEGLIS